jgi:hypothetical protein
MSPGRWLAKKPARQPEFAEFADPMGNFRFCYPKGWRFDRDVAVEDARYTISFASRDSRSTFTVAVDANLPPGFRFGDYAKRELESPSSGIYTKASRSRFHGMPAYTREFSYHSGGSRYFGGGVMFHAGQVVFSLSWNAPEADKTAMERLFGHMKERFAVCGRQR